MTDLFWCEKYTLFCFRRYSWCYKLTLSNWWCIHFGHLTREIWTRNHQTRSQQSSRYSYQWEKSKFNFNNCREHFMRSTTTKEKLQKHSILIAHYNQTHLYRDINDKKPKSAEIIKNAWNCLNILYLYVSLRTRFHCRVYTIAVVEYTTIKNRIKHGYQAKIKRMELYKN